MPYSQSLRVQCLVCQPGHMNSPIIQNSAVFTLYPWKSDITSAGRCLSDVIVFISKVRGQRLWWLNKGPVFCLRGPDTLSPRRMKRDAKVPSVPPRRPVPTAGTFLWGMERQHQLSRVRDSMRRSTTWPGGHTATARWSELGHFWRGTCTGIWCPWPP